MKAKLLIFILSLIKIISAQNWTPVENDAMFPLKRIVFINSLTGLAIGNEGFALKTTNGGNDWFVHEITFGPDLLGICFTDEMHGTIVGSEGLILRTTDGGEFWEQQYFDMSGLWETQVQAVHFFDENNGVASGARGLILRTTDGGANWIRNLLPSQKNFARMQFINNQTGFIVGATADYFDSGEVYKTTNGGIDWFPVLSTTTALLGIYFFNENEGFVTGYGKILKTTNGGSNWIDLSTFDIQGIPLTSITFIDQNIGFIIGYNGKILKTTNRGNSWVLQNSGVTSRLEDIYFSSPNKGWVVGSDPFVAKKTVLLKYSENLPGWTNITQNYTGGHRGLFFVNKDVGWLVGYEGEIKKTTNGGASWINQNSGSNSFFLSVHFTDENNGYASGTGSTLIKTTDGGVNWTPLTLPVPSDYHYVYFTKPSNGYVGGMNGLVLRTTNGGLSWSQVNTPAPYSIRSFNFISYDVGWLAGEGGYICKTTDGGETWTNQTTNTHEAFNSIYFVDKDYGWAVGWNGKILKTTNGGTTWTAQNGGTTSVLNSVFFLDRNYGWITGYDGVLLGTSDGGTTWLRYESYSNNALATISFPNNQVGYIVGENLILKYQNNNNFLSLLQPKSYDEVRGGDLVPVRWVYKPGSFQYINTEYSTDGGQNWIYYNQFQAGQGVVYWRVPNSPSENCFFRIYNADDPQLSSQNRFAFTILPKLRPDDPVIIYPENQRTGVPLTPTFHWQSSPRAETYTIELYDQNANVLILTIENIAGTFKDIPSGFLENNRIYAWRVKAKNQYGESDFSNSAVFWTSITGNGSLLIPILSYPRDGQTVYSLSPTVSWYLGGNNTGLTGYELQYAKTLNNFENICNTVFNISPNDFSRVIGPLEPGTTYYWRMRSVAGNNNYSAYSNFESFVTFGQPGGVIKPIISWPRDDAFVYTLKPELKWYLPSTPTLPLKYKVKYGTNPDLTGATEISNINDLFIVLTNSLQPNTRYYWAVCSYNGTNYSEYSDIAQFRTQPNSSVVVPIASWPRMGAMVYTNSPTLNWYLPANATNLTYKVKYSKDPNNTNNVFYVDNIQGLQTTLQNLDPGETYYWQVCSYNGSVYSDYSTPIESFVVQGQVGPEIPIASWPRDNNILYMNNTRFDWYMPTNSLGITSYTFQYSLEPNFFSPTTITGITEQYKYVTGLLPGTTYYWRVRAHKGTLVSGWSTTAVFRTENTTVSNNQGPTPAAAGWPRGGATVYTTSPQLNWYLTNSHVGVVSFLLKYSTNPNMSGAISLVFPVSVTSTTLSGLVYGQTYYWTIQSFDGTTYSTFDPPESFVVYVPQGMSATTSNYLAVPTPVVPMGGNIVYQNNVELSWKMNTNSDVKKYDLEYAFNEDFSNSTIISDITTTNYKLNNLINKNTYYWRVKAKGDNNISSDYSFTGYFKVDAPTDVKQSEIITSYKLEQNYPNPFNPSTIINYELPLNSFVTLKIYDLLGREIETLINENQQPGKYSVTWNASKYSSGVYYYELRAGEFRAIKKMLLTK